MTERPDTGDPMPDIALERPDGSMLAPSALRGMPAVLFFYPRDDTPGCTTEATDFSALLPEFERAGCAVLGISKDPPAKHRTFAEKHALTVPLASDTASEGLAEALGIWVEKRMYGRRFMGMERSTYLMDADGRIARVWRKVKVADHAATVLEAARAL